MDQVMSETRNNVSQDYEIKKNDKKREREPVDMIHGKLAGKILMYALPVAATGILQQLFNAADVAVVGRFVHPMSRATAAMAAVGANSPIVGLLVNLFVGISLGTNVVIANAVGHRDNDTIHKAVHSSIILAAFSGIIVAVIGEILAVPVMRLLSVPDDVIPMAAAYLRIYLAGIPVIVLYNFESAIFRAVGNTKTPLIALTISGIANVIGNLFFVIVIKMTVDGVALATVLSNLISSAVLFFDLVRSKEEIRIRRNELRADKKTLKRILYIGIPAGLQGAVFAVANIIIQAAINSLGTVIMAASSAAFNIEVFAYDMFNSFTQACTTFIGQNNGAGEIGRCRKILGICFIEDIIATGISVLLILLFGHRFLHIFNTDQAVINAGYIRLIYIFTAYIFSIQYEMMAGYMRGFGISVLPSVLTMIGIVGIRLFIIFAVFPHSRTFSTIMLAYPVSMAVTAALMYLAAFIKKPAKHREEELERVRA